MDGLISVLPGIGIQLFQRWGFYKTNPMAAAGFLAPTLLSAVAMALAPRIGRALAIVMVLGCLGWLAWPLIDPDAKLKDNAGISMLYSRRAKRFARAARSP